MGCRYGLRSGVLTPHTLIQDTKLADTRALLHKEKLVSGIPGLEAGHYLFMNAETNELQARGSEERKCVVKNNFIHMHDGKPYVRIAATAVSDADDGVKYIDMADLTLGKKLGDGASSFVRQAKFQLHPPGGQIVVIDVAVKMITADAVNDPRARKAIVAETERLKQCNSPFVTRCYGTAKDPATGCLYIVMELCDLGDLKGHTDDRHAL